jgi:hypothetical protein
LGGWSKIGGGDARPESLKVEGGFLKSFFNFEKNQNIIEIFFSNNFQQNVKNYLEAIGIPLTSRPVLKLHSSVYDWSRPVALKAATRPEPSRPAPV